MGVTPEGGLTGDALLEHNIAVAEGKAAPQPVAANLTPEMRERLAEARAARG